MPKFSQMENSLQEYLKCCESLDPDRIASCFAEDAVIIDPGDAHIQGKSEITQYFRSTYAGLKKLKLTAATPYWCLNSAACSWSGTAVTDDGTELTYEGIDTFDFNGQNEIERMVAYWNPNALPGSVL